MDSDILNQFDVGRVLGEGSFGLVREALHRLTKAKVAIKIIDKNLADDGRLEKLNREVDILRRVSEAASPYIVNLHSVASTENCLYLVLEYCGGGDLYELVLTRGRLREERVNIYFKQLCEAVELCHGLGIYHRDIKPENILLNDDNTLVKLTDFGLSGTAEPRALLHTLCGTINYAAPELFMRKTGYHGAQVDIWSLGVVLHVLVCGYLPFDNGTILFDETDLDLSDQLSEGIRSLLRRMLTVKPEDRITMAQVTCHPWVISTGEEAVLAPTTPDQLAATPEMEFYSLPTPQSPAAAAIQSEARQSRASLQLPYMPPQAVIVMSEGGGYITALLGKVRGMMHTLRRSALRQSKKRGLGNETVLDDKIILSCKAALASIQSLTTRMQTFVSGSDNKHDVAVQRAKEAISNVLELVRLQVSKRVDKNPESRRQPLSEVCKQVEVDFQFMLGVCRACMVDGALAQTKEVQLGCARDLCAALGQLVTFQVNRESVLRGVKTALQCIQRVQSMHSADMRYSSNRKPETLALATQFAFRAAADFMHLALIRAISDMDETRGEQLTDACSELLPSIDSLIERARDWIRGEERMEFKFDSADSTPEAMKLAAVIERICDMVGEEPDLSPKGKKEEEATKKRLLPDVPTSAAQPPVSPLRRTRSAGAAPRRHVKTPTADDVLLPRTASEVDGKHTSKSVVMSGMLESRRTLESDWTKVFVCLQPRSLTRYRDERAFFERTKPSGEIQLDEFCTVEVQQKCFTVRSMDGTLYLRADSVPDSEAWKSAVLAAASSSPKVCSIARVRSSSVNDLSDSPSSGRGSADFPSNSTESLQAKHMSVTFLNTPLAQHRESSEKEQKEPAPERRKDRKKRASVIGWLKAKGGGGGSANVRPGGRRVLSGSGDSGERSVSPPPLRSRAATQESPTRASPTRKKKKETKESPKLEPAQEADEDALSTAHTRIEELEGEVQKLQKELNDQRKNNLALGMRIRDLETDRE